MWLDSIRSRIFRPGEDLESADRRALLFGAAVTSAGLLVPKTIVSIVRPLDFGPGDIDRGIGIWPRWDGGDIAAILKKAYPIEVVKRAYATPPFLALIQKSE